MNIYIVFESMKWDCDTIVKAFTTSEPAHTFRDELVSCKGDDFVTYYVESVQVEDVS